MFTAFSLLRVITNVFGSVILVCQRITLLSVRFNNIFIPEMCSSKDTVKGQRRYVLYHSICSGIAGCGASIANLQGDRLSQLKSLIYV